MQRNLSLAMAKTIAEASLAECKSKGFNTSTVVVDRAGQVLVMLRDERATAQTAEMARRKAYTALMFRTTTMEFQKRTATDPKYAAQRDVADILALGGGAPIQVGNETIGGVGSSGSNQEMDDACAKAGIAKVARAAEIDAVSRPAHRRPTYSARKVLCGRFDACEWLCCSVSRCWPARSPRPRSLRLPDRKRS